MEKSADERMLELEIRIAYQDRLLASLDEVVREFAGRVENLEQEVRTLRRSVGGGQETGPANDVPPHY